MSNVRYRALLIFLIYLFTKKHESVQKSLSCLLFKLSYIRTFYRVLIAQSRDAYIRRECAYCVLVPFAASRSISAVIPLETR